MEFLIREATYGDIPGMMQVMDEVGSEPEHPDWFVTDDAAYMKSLLDGDGFALVAEHAGEIAAFFLVNTRPKRGHHLGEFLGFTDCQLVHSAIMDSAAVRAVYRGNGLQGKLAAAAEDRLSAVRCPFRLCTIHPDNRYSLANMQKRGYEVQKTVTCYHGRTRHVLLKYVGKR